MAESEAAAGASVRSSGSFTAKPTLLTLPPEIREKIWRLVFTVPPNNGNQSMFKKPQDHRVGLVHSPTRSRTQSVLRALLVCRQMHAECWHLFYTVNLLSFANPAALFYFIVSLRPNQRECISSIHMADLGRPRTRSITFRTVSLLALLPSLSSLYVDFDARLRLGFDQVGRFMMLSYNGMDMHDYGTTFEDEFAALSQLRGLSNFEVRSVTRKVLRYVLDANTSTVTDITCIDSMFRSLRIKQQGVELTEIVTRPRPQGLTTRWQRTMAEAMVKTQREIAVPTPCAATVAEECAEEEAEVPAQPSDPRSRQGDQVVGGRNRGNREASAQNWEATSSEDEDSDKDEGK